ncbi:MAG TPA: hypothetical protein VJ751_06570 [Pyrinomonadaceae bacterium]|nr:hypothetical protein [Pyrinomonadaceae bacterium]
MSFTISTFAVAIMKIHKTLLFALLLGWITAISAQQNYGIVSPNTRTDLKLQEAIAGMNSAEESKLLKQAVNLGCVVRSRIRAFRALGSWSDGAEHSVLLSIKGDEESLRYVLSRLGRDAQQKYVIYFHPKPTGSADLYTLLFKPGARTRTRNLVALTNTLERAGIPFRTLVPSGDTTAIYIIDLDRDLRAKILAAARKLRARVTSQPGNAALFGDDARPQAKAKFEQEIKTYETKNPDLPPTCDAQKKRLRRNF